MIDCIKAILLVEIKTKNKTLYIKKKVSHHNYKKVT